ncbi:MAG: hypothetical protein BroJett002_24420 [Candidatus Brocadia sinica]|nr:MAG: hypothetical protein BroJett002_24420 [Candidatus Brocadia sinica]
MFSVFASTIPAPATDDPKGGALGSTTGGDGGTDLLPLMTVNTANPTPKAARTGRRYFLIMGFS